MARKIIDLYRTAYSGIPRAIWLLSLIMLINRAGTMVIIFFVLYLTDVFEFSNRTAGAIISTSAIGGIFGALFGGWFSDRIGSIRSQIVFSTLVGIQFLIMLWADSLWEISIGLFGLMFFGEAVRPGVHASCLDYCETKDRKRSMGLLRLAVNLGMAIGPIIGGFLAQYQLWNWLFILDGMSCLVTAVLLYLVFGFAKHTAVGTPPQVLDDPADLARFNSQATSPWRDPQMLAFGFFYLLAVIVFIQFASTFVKFLQEVHNLSESQIGLLSAINPILIVLFEMIIIKAIEKKSTLKTIAVGSLLICTGFGLLPWAPTALFCAGCLIILSLGEILAFPMTAAYAAELSNEKTRGRYMGFITVIFSVAMIIGPVAGLSLYDIDPNLPWYVSLVIGGITFTSLWNLKPKKNSDPSVSGKLVDLN